MGGLIAKVMAATEFGAKLFLYPDEETIDFDNWPIPALPVKSLSQAMTFAQLMALGLPTISNFRLYHSCLQDPGLLLDNFHQIPSEVLEWAAERGMLAPLRDIAQLPDGFAKLSAKLNDPEMTPEHQKLMTLLFSEADLMGLASRSSQHALMVSNWCRTLVSMARQERQLHRIRHWDDLAKRVLRQFGNKLYVFYRTEEFSHCYRKFDEAFRRCLAKMPACPTQAVIARALEAQLIYIHLPIMRDDNISARVFFSEEDRVVAISLNAVTLGIDPETGEAQNIADCVHAVHLGLIRAACLIYREQFLADQQLQMLLCCYFYLLIREVMAEDSDGPGPDDPALATTCAYYYALRLMGLEAAQARDWVLASPHGVGGCEALEVDQEVMARLAGEPETDDLGAMLAMAGVVPNAAWLHRRLLVRLGAEARHGVNGAIDHLMGMCLLNEYGCGFFDGALKCPTAISEPIKALIEPYIAQITFGG